LIDTAATVSGKGWQFGLGAAALVLTAVLMSLSLRSWTKIFMALFLLSIVGVAIAVILMLIHGRGDFQSSVSRFGADYNGIISTAKGAGYAGGGTFNLTNTFSATPLAFASFGYAIVTTYAGGEIRSPRRTMLR